MKKLTYTLLLLCFVFIVPKLADSQIISSENSDDIEIKNTKSISNETAKADILKPNMGGYAMISDGNTITLDPGTYSTYLWDYDMSTDPTLTISNEFFSFYKVDVTDGQGNIGSDMISVKISDPIVGFYNIEREEPYTCSDVLVLQAYNVDDAFGFIVPGFAVSIRTDSVSLTENKMEFYKNGQYYAEQGIGTFTNNSKHYVNLQYINSEDEWSYAFVDLGNNGEFHSVSQDNCDWLIIQRDLFSFSEQDDRLESVLGNAKGTATFSGPGVVNHNNGMGRFYAQLAGPGTHTITYTWNDGRGFEGSASQIVTVTGELAVIDGGEDHYLCNEEGVILGGNPTLDQGVGGYMYQWEPALGLDNEFSSNPVANPDVTTQYTLMAADHDGMGCVVRDTVLVYVNEAIEINEEVNICSGDDFTYPDGTTETDIINNTSHISNLISEESDCDSLITTYLNVSNINTNVIIDGYKITAENMTADAYRWIDCSLQTAIEGETNYEFTANVSGEYAVEITQEDCVELSSCILISVTGTETAVPMLTTIWPNPTSDRVQINIFDNHEPIDISVFDVTGKLLSSEKVNAVQISYTVELPEKYGVYFVKIKSNTKIETFKIIKSR